MASKPLLRKADALIRLGLVAIGCAGAIAGARYLYTTYRTEPPEKNEGLVHIAAIALSSTVVNKTFTDPDILKELSTFGLKVLTHPTTVSELKTLAVQEFTTDTPTRANLKHFVVEEVIKDRWVKEELINVVQELTKDVIHDEDVYPKGVLSWLGACALTGIKSEDFKNDLKGHLLMATWDAFLGPPLPGTKFM